MQIKVTLEIINYQNEQYTGVSKARDIFILGIVGINKQRRSTL